MRSSFMTDRVYFHPPACGGHSGSWVQQNVRILAGGIDGWKADGIPGRNRRAASTLAWPFSKRRLRPDKVRDAAYMLANIKRGETLVLDARPYGRFTGEVPEPREGLRQRTHSGFKIPAGHGYCSKWQTACRPTNLRSIGSVRGEAANSCDHHLRLRCYSRHSYPCAGNSLAMKVIRCMTAHGQTGGAG